MDFFIRACRACNAGACFTFILPVFSQERAAVIADSDDSDISWRENIAAARERLRYRQNHIEDSDSGEIMTEYKEEIESQLLIDTAHKPEPAPVVAAVPDRIGAWMVLLFLAVAPPLFYLQSGQPGFILPIETRMEKQAANVEAAVEKLERYIAENPQNGEALTLLGAAMMSLQRFEEAAQYYRRARAINGNTKTLLAANIEALMASGGKASLLIKKALQTEPNDPLILWLAGLSTRNAGKLSTALGYWQRAHENMSGEEKTQLGITIADLQKQIDNGVKSLAEVEVAVFLADDLKERISPDDTLFIFAKAAQGPAVPLAVHRTTAGALPLTVVLNDDMAMTPNLKLSAFDAYSIIARISKKGDAKAQKGDLFGQQTAKAGAQIVLSINQTQP